MNAPARLGVFALAAVAAFGGGAALGAVAGPESEPDPPAHVEHDEPTSTSVTTAPAADGVPHEPGVTHP